MRVVGVPVIDRHPVQARAQVLLGPPHQVPAIGAKVGEIRGVLGRDDEAEVMAIVSATVGESGDIGRLAAGVEHARRGVVSRHALPLEIGDVTGQGGGARARAGLADDPRLDHHAAPRAFSAHAPPRAPSSARAANPAASRAWSSVARRLERPTHLPQKARAAPRTLGADPAWP